MQKKLAKSLDNLRNELNSTRKSVHLTQRQVAEGIGVATQCYQAYESGVALPTLQNFIKLCLFFDVTPNDLLGIE